MDDSNLRKDGSEPTGPSDEECEELWARADLCYKIAMAEDGSGVYSQKVEDNASRLMIKPYKELAKQYPQFAAEILPLLEMYSSKDEDEDEDVRARAELCLEIAKLEMGFDYSNRKKTPEQATHVEDVAFYLMHRSDEELASRMIQLQERPGCSKCTQLFHAGCKAIWNQQYFCGDCAAANSILPVK